MTLQINGIVDSYRANILAAYDALIREGKEPDCFTIKERLENPGDPTRLFLAEFSKYCEKTAAGGRHPHHTGHSQQVPPPAALHDRIPQVQYQKEDLPLDRISYKHIDGQNIHMQTIYKCRNNGAVNLLCCLKNFILYAIRNE